MNSESVDTFNWVTNNSAVMTFEMIKNLRNLVILIVWEGMLNSQVWVSFHSTRLNVESSSLFRSVKEISSGEMLQFYRSLNILDGLLSWYENDENLSVELNVNVNVNAASSWIATMSWKTNLLWIKYYIWILRNYHFVTCNFLYCSLTI